MFYCDSDSWYASRLWLLGNKGGKKIDGCFHSVEQKSPLIYLNKRKHAGNIGDVFPRLTKAIRNYNEWSGLTLLLSYSYIIYMTSSYDASDV